MRARHKKNKISIAIWNHPACSCAVMLNRMLHTISWSHTLVLGCIRDTWNHLVSA